MKIIPVDWHRNMRLPVLMRQMARSDRRCSCLERLAKIAEVTLSEDHPSRLASQYALAGAYQANGQIRQAVKILERLP